MHGPTGVFWANLTRFSLKRALGDTAWAEWKITATESTNEERAQEIFFEEELRKSLQAKLCSATEGLQPGTDLDAVLKKQKTLLETEASRVIVANWETDYESDEVVVTTAVGAKKATSEVAPLFTAEMKMHVAARVDLVEMLSHSMVESACVLLKKIAVGATVMHVRQSGTLQEVLTKLKRRKFRSAPSCNDRGESILASIDRTLSLRPNQTTASASAVAVVQQNPELIQIVVKKMMNPKTVAACELDIEAARQTGVVQRAMDKQRSVAANAYAVKRAEVKLERRQALNVLRREQRAAIDAIVRVEDASAVLKMKEAVLREQFKKWKASYFFEGVDEAAWCAEFQTHFDAIPGFDSTDTEQLRALHVTLREQLPAGELGVEAFDKVRLDAVSFRKMLVPGIKQGGPRKDPFVYKCWMRKLRAQLQALVSLYLRQHPAVIVAMDATVTTAPAVTITPTAVTTTPNSVAAMELEGGADVASEDSINNIDSDSDSDSDSSSDSDSDEDDAADAGEGDSFKRLLRDQATELERAAFKCFMELGGVRETCVWLSGNRREYYLYTPPGGGKKLRSLKEVRQYLDAIPLEVDDNVEFSRTLGEVDLVLPTPASADGVRVGGRKRKPNVTIEDIDQRGTNTMAKDDREVAIAASTQDPVFAAGRRSKDSRPKPKRKPAKAKSAKLIGSAKSAKSKAQPKPKAKPPTSASRASRPLTNAGSNPRSSKRARR
jgi:hypothetical protein